MPVHLESHTPEIEIDPNTTKGRIIAFLYQNPEFGFKPVEIQEELEIPNGTATGTLTRLYNEGKIGKTQDSYYHALENEEDMHRFAAAFDQLTRLTERHQESPRIKNATQTKSREEQLAELTDTPSEEELESEIAAIERESNEE